MEAKPDLQIEGDEYPLPPLVALLANIIDYAKIAAMVFVFFGDTICQKLGIPVPTWYNDVKEKKFIIIMALFFLGGMMSNAIRGMTGAFEIYVNDDIHFSKIESG